MNIKEIRKFYRKTVEKDKNYFVKNGIIVVVKPEGAEDKYERLGITENEIDYTVEVFLPFRTVVKGCITSDGEKYTAPEEEWELIEGVLKVVFTSYHMSYCCLFEKVEKEGKVEITPVRFQHQEGWKLCYGEVPLPSFNAEDVVRFRDELEKTLEYVNLGSAYSVPEDSRFYKFSDYYIYKSPKWRRSSSWGVNLVCSICGSVIDAEEEEAIECAGCGEVVCSSCATYSSIDETYYCDNCFRDRFEICSICEEEYYREDLYECEKCHDFVCSNCIVEVYDRNMNGFCYCKYCYERRINAVECEGCGDKFFEEATHVVKDSRGEEYYYCNDCYHRKVEAVECIGCNEVFYKAATVEVIASDGSIVYYCRDCVDSNTYKCSNCGKFFEAAVEGNDGKLYCEECFVKLFPEEEIEE